MKTTSIRNMTGVETFCYGALGATVGAFIVHVLPIGYAMAAGTIDVVVTRGRVVGVLIILVGLIAVGGLAALGLGSATPGGATTTVEAIAYGLGWQSTIGALLNASSSPTLGRGAAQKRSTDVIAE
jgi:uncharacterized membrane protein YbjE (DUF340 family)